MRKSLAASALVTATLVGAPANATPPPPLSAEFTQKVTCNQWGSTVYRVKVTTLDDNTNIADYVFTGMKNTNIGDITFLSPDQQGGGAGSSSIIQFRVNPRYHKTGHITVRYEDKVILDAVRRAAMCDV